MYLAIDIQMLILVVKLYVFSDYILRKRVPKSQISAKAIFVIIEIQTLAALSWISLDLTLKQWTITLFGALGKIVKIARFVRKNTIYASTYYVLDCPTYWYKSQMRYLRGRNIWENIYFPNKYLNTEFWLWYSIVTKPGLNVIV